MKKDIPFPKKIWVVCMEQPGGQGLVWPLVETDDGRKGTVFFTTEEKARAYAKANDLGPEWRVDSISRGDLLLTLRYNLVNGIPLVVIDAEGQEGGAVEVLEFLAQAEISLRPWTKEK